MAKWLDVHSVDSVRRATGMSQCSINHCGHITSVKIVSMYALRSVSQTCKTVCHFDVISATDRQTDI